MCLLNENVSIEGKCVYWMKVSINRKCAYWMKWCLPKGVYWNVITLHIRYTKRCLLIENVPINWKCAYWKIKSHNCSVFLNVYFALIYVAM